MPTPDTNPPTLWGPVNGKRNKQDLDEIAMALGIFRKKDRKDIVLRRIQAHLEKHPELAKEKRFQGLFAYRKDMEVAGGAPKGSEEKEAEDELEASKTQKEATGALKTLLDRDIARDPPRRTTRLNSSFARFSAQDKAADEERSDEEESSPEPTSAVPSKSRTPVTSTEPENEVSDELEANNATGLCTRLPETPKKTGNPAAASYGHDGGQELNPDVIVTFQHDSGPVDEVHVPGAGRLVRRVRDQHGEEHAMVRLSELLPVAFEFASTPMKNRGGRLSRPGTIGDSHVDIGSVAAFARKERVKYLESEKANSYELQRACEDSNTLVCRLFVRDEGGPLVKLASTSMLAVAQPSAVDVEAIKAGPSSKAITPQPNVQSGKDTDVEDPFILWLRERLDGPKREWKKGLLVSIILPRVKALRGTLERLSDWGWERSQGGYQVPEDDDAAGLYSGRSFKKDDIIKALKLGSTTANNNDKLFTPAIMRQIPKLLEWYNSPDGEHAAFFRDMTTKQFLKWRDDEYALATGSKGKEKAKRKHAEGGESRTSKKAKRISSEELDSD